VDVQRRKEPTEVAYGELPELTPALRALGSSRGGGGSHHAQFFRPLLDARRKAAEARNAIACLRAFDAAELEHALERTLDRILAAWPDERAPVRRAVRAEMGERVRVYRVALTRLSELASGAVTAEPDAQVTAWRAWTVQLAATFGAADRSWIALSSLVHAIPEKTGP
jgi:hypothetical protein